MKNLLSLVCVFNCFCIKLSGALFPRESESREIKVLDGLWNFRIDNSTNRNEGFEKKWFNQALKKSGDVIKMPVPSSYNDVTQDINIRDFIGWVWYDREFFVSAVWNNEEYVRVVMRFESCHYFCIVWVNGEKLMEHDGGHLPFESEVSHVLKFGESNIVTVAANNTLSPTTLPPGSIKYLEGRKYPPGYFVQDLQMDFFNYAGIHRPVKLYVTPTVFLLDVTLETSFENSLGIVNFTSSVAALDNGKWDNEDTSMLYEIYDAEGKSLTNISGNNLFKGTMNISNVNLWWPVDMGHVAGYQYTLQITVSVQGVKQLTDIYRLLFGFRTVKVTKNTFQINNEPFYFKGFGMHEDADIRGKGLDLPTITKNFNLIEWISANAFRTSHYPYAEEILDFADRQGIVVIDESPGVGILRENMKDENVAKHKSVMKELVHRDKNHPSVVMWSVANEPESQYEEAESYFKKVIEYTKQLDSSRPVTFVGNQSPYDDKAVKFNDVICYNHYYAWYHDYGHLDLISQQLEDDILLWYNITGKPFILSEYGADAVAGLYQHPPVMFTEDFQVEAVKKYFPVFDKYRKQYMVGEMIWNFADFATDQSTTRVAGNKKGVFTRQRQPKHIAYVFRERYKSLTSNIKDHDTRSYLPQYDDGYNLSFVDA